MEKCPPSLKIELKSVIENAEVLVKVKEENMTVEL